MNILQSRLRLKQFARRYSNQIKIIFKNLKIIMFTMDFIGGIHFLKFSQLFKESLC